MIAFKISLWLGILIFGPIRQGYKNSERVLISFSSSIIPCFFISPINMSRLCSIFSFFVEFGAIPGDPNFFLDLDLLFLSHFCKLEKCSFRSSLCMIPCCIFRLYRVSGYKIFSNTYRLNDTFWVIFIVWHFHFAFQQQFGRILSIFSCFYLTFVHKCSFSWFGFFIWILIYMLNVLFFHYLSFYTIQEYRYRFYENRK